MTKRKPLVCFSLDHPVVTLCTSRLGTQYLGMLIGLEAEEKEGHCVS